MVYKAVVNSQAIHEFLDGPDGTRLEYFNRMLVFFDILTAVDEKESPILPENYCSLTAYPNPFNAQVNLRLSARIDADSKIEIFDITGRKIRSFKVSRGIDQITWDGRNDQGKQVASGVYFAKANSDNYESSSVKLTLLR